jgi:hypothetical protein
MSEGNPSTSPPPLTGGCLCGGVRYEVAARIEVLVNCHCRFCRRAHGAAFATTSPVPTRSLRIVEGEALLTRHGGRFFCGRCGTRLFSRASALPEVTALMVTGLDSEPTLAPSAHLNLESKAPWYEILDDAPRFDAFPEAISAALDRAD